MKYPTRIAYIDVCKNCGNNITNYGGGWVHGSMESACPRTFVEPTNGRYKDAH